MALNCLPGDAEARIRRHKRYYKPRPAAVKAAKPLNANAAKKQPAEPWHLSIAKADASRELATRISKGEAFNNVAVCQLPAAEPTTKCAAERYGPTEALLAGIFIVFAALTSITLLLIIAELLKLRALMITRSELDKSAVILGTLKAGKGLTIRLVKINGALYALLVDSAGRKISSAKINDVT